MLKFWIDDLLPAPDTSWTVVKSVNAAKGKMERFLDEIEVVSLDGDAGEFEDKGGDFVAILEWFEQLECESDFRVCFPIHLHTRNTSDLRAMRSVIQRNGWKEISDLAEIN